MPIRLCLAGATGWASSALALALATTSDIQPVSAVSYRSATRAGFGVGNLNPYSHTLYYRELSPYKP
jgi:hypothetical protein